MLSCSPTSNARLGSPDPWAIPTPNTLLAQVKLPATYLSAMRWGSSCPALPLLHALPLLLHAMHTMGWFEELACNGLAPHLCFCPPCGFQSKG